MNQALIDKIKTRGYWRINFRPLAPAKPALTLNDCLRAVERNQVSLRGWNYPHVPSRTDDIGRLANAVEAWTDWSTHNEYWRMYSSTQFIHYRSIAEDWRGSSPFEQSGDAPEQQVLGVVYHTWTLAEVFEFLARLTKDGLYQEGVEVSISLMNTAGRVLRIDDPDREFTYERITNAESLLYESELTVRQIAAPKARAGDAVLFFWDKFGFEPARDQVTTVIEQLYRGR